ncbi:MFS transporter [Rubrobacter marinus]|uniref:MFS transporter n=1 Tax=Rubrobacter marinus TaxID=2653852 RepID=A0A6G8PVB1_9ACTN|nr:MFS transporter [Rubrobacter marinus]QIN78138.1 MFS transporter [Rubrobacter marinus]
MRRLLILTCAMVLVDTIFYAALTPLLPYYTGELGLSRSAAGILSGAFGVGVLLGSAPGGYLAARLGVRATALLGLGLMSATSLLFGFAEAAWWLISLRFLAGFGSALSWVSAFTWLVARTPEEQRGQMIGTLVSAAVVGALLGPVLGGAAATFGISLTFALVSAFGLAVALWVLLTPAPAPTGSGSLFGFFAAFSRPDLRVGLAFIGFSPLLFGVLTVLAPLQLSALGWGALAVGIVFLAAAAVESVVHPLLGRWSDKRGYRPPILAGLLASLAILILLPWAGAPLLVALLVVLAGGAFNAPLVPGTSMFSRAAEKAGVEGALAFGATNFAWAAGYAVGASSGGILSDLGGDLLSYSVLAAVCLLALLPARRAL